MPLRLAWYGAKPDQILDEILVSGSNGVCAIILTVDAVPAHAPLRCVSPSAFSRQSSSELLPRIATRPRWRPPDNRSTRPTSQRDVPAYELRRCSAKQRDPRQSIGMKSP